MHNNIPYLSEVIPYAIAMLIVVINEGRYFVLLTEIEVETTVGLYVMNASLCEKTLIAMKVCPCETTACN